MRRREEDVAVEPWTQPRDRIVRVGQGRALEHDRYHSIHMNESVDDATQLLCADGVHNRRRSLIRDIIVAIAEPDSEMIAARANAAGHQAFDAVGPCKMQQRAPPIECWR